MNALKDTVKQYAKQIEQTDDQIAGIERQLAILKAKKSDLEASKAAIEKLIPAEPEGSRKPAPTKSSSAAAQE